MLENELDIEKQFQGGDEMDEDYISALIDRKIDPFNINHKKSKNLYRDTLLRSAGVENRIVMI